VVIRDLDQTLKTRRVLCFITLREAPRGPRAVLHPGQFAQVKMPIGAVCHAKRFRLVLVGNSIQVNRWRNDVDENIPAQQGNESGASFRTPEKFESDRINREKMSCYPGDSTFVHVDDANEVTMRFLFEIAPMDDVNFLACGKNRALHLGFRVLVFY
jgi:hypothetical protein